MPQSLEELTEWHREIYQDKTIGGEHPEDRFDKHLATVGPNQIWVAVRGSQVLGLVGLILRGDEAEIEPIIVSKAHRGVGIGSQLFETAIAEARRRAVRLLTVRPVARNIETIQFLHKHGFKNVDSSSYSWTCPSDIGNQTSRFLDAISNFDRLAILEEVSNTLDHQRHICETTCNLVQVV